LAHDLPVTAIEAELIQPGWDIYSSDDERVGTVRAVDDEHIEMALEVLGGSVLLVPLASVEAADDGRVDLDVPAEEIGTMGWDAPPPEA